MTQIQPPKLDDVYQLIFTFVDGKLEDIKEAFIGYFYKELPAWLQLIRDIEPNEVSRLEYQLKHQEVNVVGINVVLDDL